MKINQPQTLDAIQTLLGDLPATDVPTALLPVNLETRFVTQAETDYLCVRIFPDDVHVDTHEPELTPDEERWGRHLWEQTWHAGRDPAVEQALQDELVQRFGPGRAAWIVQALKPENPQDRPDTAIDEADPLPKAIAYPAVKQRDDSWTRPPLVRALPDRWVAMAYRSGERVLMAVSEPIQQGLAAGPDPQALPPDNPDDSVVTVDLGMRWMLDFETAIEAGMALRIPLTETDIRGGFDRLIVLGVSTQGNASGLANAQEIESLIAAHYYTDSLDFVPQGTPSNNTAAAAAGYANSEPEQETDLLSQRRMAAGSADCNCHVTATAFGIDPSALGQFPHASDREQADAEAMNTALWPATWGYFFRYMMANVSNQLSNEQIDRIRQHFQQFVRARGPIPVLRMGRQPYGILPVTSLDRYQPQLKETFGPEGIHVLRHLRDRWRQAAQRIPRVTPGLSHSQLSESLANILGMQPISDRLKGRIGFDGSLYGLAPAPGLNFLQLHDATERYQAAHRQLTQITGLDLPPDPWALSIPAAVMVFTDALYQLSQTMVGPTGISPADRLDPNYISVIRNASFIALRDGLPDAEAQEIPLAVILRHSLLLAYAEVADQIQPKEHSDPGLVDIFSQDPNADPPATADEPPRTRTPLRILEGQENTIDTLTPSDHPAVQTLEDIRTSLDHLADLSVSDLEELFRETLDLASHRLDAWITSLATARLHELRQKQPKGLIIGGYGWVEDLRKINTRTAVDSIPLGEENADFPLGERTDNGGYVAAPSLNQAATAAILRSGYLNHGKTGPTEPFAIDLSSERVRLAQWLLDGVRQGQALGALLGYRFERALKEHQSPSLAAYIRPFRILAPFGERYRLESQKATLEDELADLVDQQNNEERPLIEDIAQLESDILSLNVQISTKTTSRSRLQYEVDNLNQQISSLESDRDREQRSYDSVNAELKILMRNNPDLNSEKINELTQDLLEISRRINDINDQIESLESQRTSKQNQINQLSSEITSLTNQRNNKQNELGLKNNELNTMQEEHAAERNAIQAQINDLVAAIATATERYRNERLYPPTASIQSLEAIEAEHVVDGLALMSLWQTQAIPFGNTNRGLPEADSLEGKALQAQLDLLIATVDAVSDLVTAESVYQLTLGNNLRAGATLDSVAKGEIPPPEIEVVNTPRSGIAHTHRVSVLLSGETEPPPAWTVDDFQQRALAEPILNRWLATLLGDPNRIRIEATYCDAQTETPLLPITRYLNDFFLSPLDAVYLATTNETGTGSPLEAVITYRLLRSRPQNEVPANAVVRFSYDRGPDWAADEISLGTFMELARAARELITAARPLDARDWVLPQGATGRHFEPEQLKRRADVAVNAYETARRHLDVQRDALDPADPNLDLLRSAIFRFCYLGHANGIPTSATGNDDDSNAKLLEQIETLAEDADRRLAALNAAVEGVDRQTLSADAAIELDIKRLQIIFGEDFRVLPHFQLPNAVTLQSIFDDSLSLQGQDPLAAITWLDQIAHVREGAQRLQTCLSYAEVLQPGFEPNVAIAQLPYDKGDRWVGLPLDPQKPNDTSRLSLVTFMPAAGSLSTPLCGLMVDEWVETIPNPREIAGVGFHFDAPQSHPPHAILLAVSPDDQPQWQLETLESIVLETLDLTKLRAVDNAALFAEPDHGHFLPALYVAHNAEPNTTVSSDFSQISDRLVRPIISRMTPSSGNQGQRLTVTIAGAGLTNPSAVEFSGSGITVRSFSSISDFALQVDLSISDSASISRRTVQVTTIHGELNSRDSGVSFQIQSPPPPSYGSTGSSAIGADLL